MSEPKELHADARRQAVASFTGAAYQAWQSIDAWLRVQSDDDVIYLEGAEDFDRVGGVEPDAAVQVRHTGASISLGTAKAHEALENFWSLSERELGRVVHMHYVTTSSPARERDGTFGELIGLDAWRAARTSAALASAVAVFLSGKLDGSSSLRHFLEHASAEELQERLFKRFFWFTDQADIDGVQRSVDDRLASILASQGRSTKLAPKIRPHLESAFWTAVREPKSAMRRLTKGGLHRVIDDALTTYLPIPVERATEIFGLAAPGVGLLSLLREKVPQPPTPLLPRPNLVQEIKKRVEDRRAVLLTGTVFKGKTTVAQLAAELVCPDAWWVALGGRSLEQTDAVLLALARQVDSESCPAIIVVDDLDVSAAALRTLRSSLSLLLHRAAECGRGVILTAQGSALTVKDFVSIPNVHVIDVPEFGESEIQALCVALGCPEDSSHSVAFTTHARTQGHPKLVQIRLSELAKAHWQTSFLEALTEVSPGVQSARHLSRALLGQTVPEKLGELVYSASEASILLHREVLMSLAEKMDIANPGDAIDAIAGTWLERVEEDWYRVTPLLQGAASDAWTQLQRQRNHVRLHEAIRSKETLSPAEAAALLFHAYHSKAWKLVSMDAMRLQILESSDAQNAVLRHLFWLPFLALGPGQNITGDRVSGASLRSMQFKVALVLDSETLPAICERWLDETVSLPAGELREGMLNSMWAAFLSAESAKVPLRLRLKAVEMLPAADGEIGRIIVEGLQTAFTRGAPNAGIPARADPVGLMLFLASRWVRSEASLRELLCWLGKASRSVQNSFDSMLDWPFAQTLGAVVHGAWSTDHENISDWMPWLKLFDDIMDYANQQRSLRFGLEAAKAKSIILSEQLDDSRRALEVLADAEHHFGASIVLEEQRANVLFHGEDDEGVLQVWEELAKQGSHGSLNDPYAYRRAAVSAGRLDRWKLSAEMFAEGAKKVSTEGFELTQFGMNVDCSLSLFFADDVVGSVRCLAEAVSSLPAAASQEGEPRWEAVQRIASEVSFLIDKRTSGTKLSEERVRSGDASSPSQKMKETSQGQEFRTFALRASVARVAARHGESENIDLDGLKRAPYRLVRFTCAEARLALSLARAGSGFDEALRDYDYIFSSVTLAPRDESGLLERDTSPTVAAPTGTAWAGLILAAAWCSGANASGALHDWQIRFDSVALHAPASLARQVGDGITAAAADLHAFRDTQLDPFVRYGAALGRLLSEPDLVMRVRLQNFVLSGLMSDGSARLQDYWNLAIARRLAAELAPRLQHRFQFVRPRESIPLLENAIDNVALGAGTLRTLLLALHTALGISPPRHLAQVW